MDPKSWVGPLPPVLLVVAPMSMGGYEKKDNIVLNSVRSRGNSFPGRGSLKDEKISSLG